MNNKQLTIVALKAVAIYLFIKALLGISNSVGMLITLNTWFGGLSATFVWLSGVIVIAISVILAILIWRFANSIAKSMMGDETNRLVDIANENNIEAILLSILGLFLMIYGISSLSYAISHIFTIAESKQYPEGVPADYITYAIVQFVVFLVGLSLIVKPQRWGLFLQKLRTLGLENK